MPARLTDLRISQLIDVSKPFPQRLANPLRFRPKRQHQELDEDITSNNGDEFRLIVRINTINSSDFSVILAYRFPYSNELFRLRRYNRLSHQHTNAIEREVFFDYHIHQATQRYQDLGFKEDHYASPTDRYSDLQGAIQCMLTDCHFDDPPLPWEPHLF